MFGNRWRVLTLYGIPISVDASWLVILALLTLTTASMFPGMMHYYFGPATPTLSPYEYWIMGLVTALAFFACIVLHELGHAIVARSRGMPIAGITLFLFGGVAELQGEPESAGTEFAMAIAGPIVSVVLGIVFGVLAWSGYYAHWAPVVVMVLAYLALINLFVLAFNLVPAFPLDGGRVLALHPVGSHRQFAAVNLLGVARRPSLRLAAHRFWRRAIVCRELDRRHLVGADWPIPQQRGPWQLPASPHPQDTYGRGRTAVHEPAPHHRVAVVGPAPLCG